MAAKKLLEREQLKVFDRLPVEAVNATIQETFIAPVKSLQSSGTPGDGKEALENVKRTLREKVFAGWPAETNAMGIELQGSAENHGVRMSAYAFQSQPHVELWVYVFQRTKGQKPDTVRLAVLDEENWKDCLATFDPWLGIGDSSQRQKSLASSEGGSRLEVLRRDVEAGKLTLALFAPRGVGPTAWTAEEKKQINIRRRFMLLGQTLDGMRVWDIRRAVQVLRVIRETKTKPLSVEAGGPMGVNTLYAALFEPDLRRLELKQLPASHVAGPDYLNVLHVLDVPQALQLASKRTELVLQ